MQWHKAKKRHLPVFCTNLSKSDKKIIQKSSLGSVIISCFSNNFATLLMIKSLLNLIICCPLSLNNFKYMKFVVSFLLGIPKIKKYANRKKQD